MTTMPRDKTSGCTYGERDVVLVFKLHVDEAKCQPGSTNLLANFLVPSKQRPMLIFRIVDYAQYQALEFTTKAPKSPQDFAKNGDGEARTFLGKELGLDRECYLRVKPLLHTHEKLMRRRLGAFPRELHDHVVREVIQCLRRE